MKMFKPLPNMRPLLLCLFLFFIISPSFISPAKALTKGQKTVSKTAEAANIINTSGKVMKKRLKKVKVKKSKSDTKDKSGRDYTLTDSYGAPLHDPLGHMASAIHAATSAAAATAAANAVAANQTPAAANTFTYTYNPPTAYSVPSNTTYTGYYEYYPQQQHNLLLDAAANQAAAAMAAAASPAPAKTRVPRFLSFFSGSKFIFNVKLEAPIPFCQFPGAPCKPDHLPPQHPTASPLPSTLFTGHQLQHQSLT